MGSRSSSYSAAAIAASLGLLSASLVHAQSGVDRAAAEALFQDGLKLMEQQRYDVACPKIEESLRLEPGLGTLLYLAECQERLGLFASAWTNFLEAQSLAKAAGQIEREKAAKRRAALLLPRVHKLAIDVARPVPDGTMVRRNGTVLGAVSLGTLLPVDPGTYVVEVSAPGYAPSKRTLQVPGTPGESRVFIPPLVALAETAASSSPAVPVAPSASVTPPARSADPSTPVPQQVIGGPKSEPPGSPLPAYVAGGIGGVGLVVGTILGARAFGQWDVSNQHCPRGACDQEGVDAAQRAKTAATVSTIGFVVGAVGVSAGLTLWITRKKGRDPGGDVALVAQPTGVSLQGAF